ncbi:hypothetical protein ABG067_007616 [Albugo candida]
MLNIEAEIRLYNGGKFTVGTDNTVNYEIKGSCAGGTVTLYTTDNNLILYAIKHAEKHVNMLVQGPVVMKAWVSDNNQARPRLQGTCEQMQRLRSRVNRVWMPMVSTEAVGSLPISKLTDYLVMRHVASKWGTDAVVVRGHNSLGNFCIPMQALHNELVEEEVIADGPLVVSGVLPDENEMEEDEENDDFAEQLRRRREREQEASDLVISPIDNIVIN